MRFPTIRRNGNTAEKAIKAITAAFFVTYTIRNIFEAARAGAAFRTELEKQEAIRQATQEHGMVRL